MEECSQRVETGALLGWARRRWELRLGCLDLCGGLCTGLVIVGRTHRFALVHLRLELRRDWIINHCLLSRRRFFLGRPWSWSMGGDLLFVFAVACLSLGSCRRRRRADEGRSGSQSVHLSGLSTSTWNQMKGCKKPMTEREKDKHETTTHESTMVTDIP